MKLMSSILEVLDKHADVLTSGERLAIAGEVSSRVRTEVTERMAPIAYQLSAATTVPYQEALTALVNTALGENR